VASFVPTLCVLSVAATARNIYLAPALPGAALLLGWWVQECAASHDPWERRAIRATSLLLVLAAIACAAAAVIVGRDAGDGLPARPLFAAVSALGVAAAAALAAQSWRTAGRGTLPRAVLGLLVAYAALLVGPASQIYRRVDAWQDLAAIGQAMRRDAEGRPLILYGPDETTRAFIDMYTRTSVMLIPLPVTAASAARLRSELAARPESLVVAQLPGRDQGRRLRELAASWGLAAAPRPAAGAAAADQGLPWAAGLPVRIAHRYDLPNGRRYVLLAATASR
jgi:4-amino-4-deoxy-L-arabinose transferase-like glycosyltransferase